MAKNSRCQSLAMETDGRSLSMSLPFLFTFKDSGSRPCIVQVFKVPTDIGTDISLLKSINIELGGFILRLKPFYSPLVVGVLCSRQTVGTILHVFEKAKLLDESVLPENVDRREVELGAGWYPTWLSSMNTTSLVYIKNHDQGGQLHRQSLVKKNFWMSNSKSE